ncbi:TonB-dependent receptor [Granulicella arctica]|uniref:TonB-dependent receptor n=1 Tax=Granulicella arctica TaxID=940613 RepID=UPI0015CA9EDA|nr:TonB-dependent receptor [Granulicella arctica]
MKCWFLLLCVCFFASVALCQSTNATISGGVTDVAGKLILDADVEIANDATGVIYSARTNGSGMYLVPILPPGHYHVQVSKPGFKTIIKADLVLNVQSAVALNFVLPVGATSESVTVDAGSSAINTTDASVSTVVDRKFVENMPLNGRSFQDLISLAPGVVNQTPQYAQNQIVGGGGDFSVNGQRAQSNYYTVDGVTANISSGNGGGTGAASTGGALGATTALGTTQTLVSVDALQEFRIQSSTYAAEFGRSPGGQFSMATRSGSDQLHGSAYEYLRNNYFDANNWFNDHYGLPTPALRQSDFGGTFGGPVVLPKLYSGLDRTFFFVSYEGLRLTQPIAATIQYVPDIFMRQQAIPAMQPILNAFPVPNGIDYGTSSSPSLAQFIKSFSLPSTINSTSVRVDHTVNPKLAIFFRVGDTPSSTDSRPYFARSTTAINAQTYTFGANSMFSARWNNEFRLGYARSNSSEMSESDSFGGATPTNLSAAMGAGSYAQVVPVIDINIAGIGAPFYAIYNSRNLGRQWNLVDSVSLLNGNHHFRFGVDFRNIKSLVAPPQIEPYAIFLTPSSVLTGHPSIPYVFSFLQSTPLFHQLALYAQDEWQIQTRLHLSYGLRWEVNPPPTEQHGDDAFTLRGDINQPSTLTVAPRGTSLWNTSWYNFAPRVGIAWTAHDKPGAETVVRAGGGVFFDSANEIASVGFNGLGFRASALRSGAQLPYTPAQLNVPIGTTAPYTSGVVTAYPEHLQLPYTLEWNVSLQQALGARQSLTVSYVAAAGRRLMGLQQRSISALNPNFGLIQYFATGVTSNYQGLQVQFQRSVAKGLQVLTSYTWSHTIDLGSQSATLALQRGNADFDVRHNLQSGLSWELPIVSGPKPLATLANNWGVDLRLVARTAYPITLGGTTQTNPATGAQYNSGLNIIPNVPIYLYSPQYAGGKIINPAAFSLPTTGVEGNAPRNFARGFGATQVNLSVRRDFPLHNEVALHFRAETFNLLNHPIFGYVDPTYSDATFGQATQTLNASLGTMASQYQQGGPRSMQFALRLTF